MQAKGPAGTGSAGHGHDLKKSAPVKTRFICFACFHDEYGGKMS
jgi:hypothetical protein